MHLPLFPSTLAMISAFALSACAKAETSPDALRCEGTFEGLGMWRIFDYPMKEISEEINGQVVSGEVTRAGAFFDDGRKLLFLEVGDDIEGLGWLYELETPDLTWEGHPRIGRHGMHPSRSLIAASEDYVFMQGGTVFDRDMGKTWAPTTSDAALLDRSTMTWTVYPPPPEYEGRTASDAKAFWTGSAFGLFGGVVSDSDSPALLEDTELTRNYDGQFFDPVEKTWRRIPPLRPPETHTYGNHNPYYEVTSAWTEVGLFVWGRGKGGTEVIGLFPPDGGEWIIPQSAKSPPLRAGHSLVHGDGSVYLFGGWSGKIYRDLWRFSLDTLEWSEIEVPRYADVSVSGAWLNGKLVFIGRCPSNVLYDPQTDTWEKLTSELAPPGAGALYVAGNTVFVDSPDLDGHPVNGIWAWNLEPVTDPGGMGGEGGAGGGN